MQRLFVLKKVSSPQLLRKSSDTTPTETRTILDVVIEMATKIVVKEWLANREYDQLVENEIKRITEQHDKLSQVIARATIENIKANTALNSTDISLEKLKEQITECQQATLLTMEHYKNHNDTLSESPDELSRNIESLEQTGLKFYVLSSLIDKKLLAQAQLMQIKFDNLCKVTNASEEMASLEASIARINKLNSAKETLKSKRLEFEAQVKVFTQSQDKSAAANKRYLTALKDLTDSAVSILKTLAEKIERLEGYKTSYNKIRLVLDETAPLNNNPHQLQRLTATIMELTGIDLSIIEPDLHKALSLAQYAQTTTRFDESAKNRKMDALEDELRVLHEAYERAKYEFNADKECLVPKSTVSHPNLCNLNDLTNFNLTEHPDPKVTILLKGLMTETSILIENVLPTELHRLSIPYHSPDAKDAWFLLCDYTNTYKIFSKVLTEFHDRLAAYLVTPSYWRLQSFSIRELCNELSELILQQLVASLETALTNNKSKLPFNVDETAQLVLQLKTNNRLKENESVQLLLKKLEVVETVEELPRKPLRSSRDH